MLDTSNKFYQGSLWRYLVFGVRKEECHGYGKDVISATEGEVVECADGLEERNKVHLWQDLRYAARIRKQAQLGTERKINAAGNYVIVRTENHYLLYAHLKTGSIQVRKGDTVGYGEAIGQVGHSGNSMAANDQNV